MQRRWRDYVKAVRADAYAPVLSIFSLSCKYRIAPWVEGKETVGVSASETALALWSSLIHWMRCE